MLTGLWEALFTGRLSSPRPKAALECKIEAPRAGSWERRGQKYETG